MKNFRLVEMEQFRDASRYQPAEEGIYQDLQDEGGFATYRMALAAEREEGEDDQYPLEDILDEFLVHVEEFPETDGDHALLYIFGGELDDLRNLKTIIGKRAGYENYTDENGQTRIRLVIG